MSAESWAFVIPGNPIVKKNTQKVVHWRGRSFVVYSANYRAWQHRALDELNLLPKPGKPISEPTILMCKFFMQTKRRVDLSALYEGIQDTLVKAGILEDDNFNIVAGHDGSRVLLDRLHPRTEVYLWPKDHFPAPR